MEYKWVALTVTTIGVLMVVIDTRIVIIVLPQVSEQLHADIEQVIWINPSLRVNEHTNAIADWAAGRHPQLLQKVLLQ